MFPFDGKRRVTVAFYMMQLSFDQVAVPDPRNAQRRGQDAAFLTQHHRADAGIHPGDSSLKTPHCRATKLT